MCIKCELLDIINKSGSSNKQNSALPKKNYSMIDIYSESREITAEAGNIYVDTIVST